MTENREPFEEMRKSSLNARVGGADPEAVGAACFQLIDSHLQLAPDSKILDFGCGIGRVLHYVATQRKISQIVGMDIMPDVIEFCRTHIAPSNQYAHFELIADTNDHYDRFGTNRGITKEQNRNKYQDYFDEVYAFSVFTHVDYDDFSSLLADIRNFLKPGGKFLFSAFALTNHSKSMIDLKRTQFGFEEGGFERSGAIIVGKHDDRLAFIGYELSIIEKFIFDAGLVLNTFEAGTWTGSGVGRSLQDLFVCERPRG